MKLEDVMTTQEAGKKWNVPADSIKQCCLKRYKNKQFTDDECRKSGKSWLVTKKGMERLYGEDNFEIENLTNIKIRLIEMDCIIGKLKSVDEWEKYQDKFNKNFEYLLSYDLPEEVYSIQLIKSLLVKKDIETIKILISICLEWIQDELAGVHRQVFIVEEE